MSEAQTEVKPSVGIGSPAGRRWFVSKYSEISFTLSPEKNIPSDGVKQKAKRIIFKKEVMPRSLRGFGTLSSDDPDRTDRNASVYWGIYDTHDPLNIQNRERAGITDEQMLKWLREHENYRKTEQDNILRADTMSKMFLKELNWDPAYRFTDRDTGLVKVRTMGPEGESEVKVEGAPKDGVPSRPGARVVKMGSK